MLLDVARARRYLKEFDLTTLFIEELGWDHHVSRLDVSVDGQTFSLNAIAEKRGMVAFAFAPLTDGRLPDYATRRRIERQVAKSAHEHLIIYTDASKTSQIWQWVKREAGKPTACREHTYQRHQPGDALIQKLQAIAFSLEEEESLTIVDVASRARAGFDVDRVTKRFYDRFKAEHDAFLKFLKGVPDEEMQRWYASVMLNRLMFIYFIQKKGFLDNDTNYLRSKLVHSQQRGRDRFYADFLCPLFFEGFAQGEQERSTATNQLLGKVPYLNGGLFLRHQIEELYGKSLQIADTAFEKLFAFFEQYQWHLDERPLRADNEINPDVLGYIFEKYINQKQMGAYYTKEDITGYICKNTVIPFLFDAARQQCKIAFEGEHSVWRLMQADPDRYIYPAVKKGVDSPLPSEIAVGLNDVAKRTAWNKPAPADYALPTEIWREVVARRKRYEEVKNKLSVGEVQSINDLITYNLDIRQFAQDVIENCEGPELLRAFYHAIEKVTVLDPTCGSGAFLFAALNILEPLYEACLDRMQVFLDELERSGEKHRPEKFGDFRKILQRVAEHPNRRYFILKSIIVNNLFGVDIMEEAVEICKLRLFLKLVAQIERVEDIEPLPDIDFNIRAGNTLVGYATYDDVQRAVTSKLDFEGVMERIEERAQDVNRLFGLFRQMQTEHGMDAEDFADAKRELRKQLRALEDELNRYLAGEYGVEGDKPADYQKWLASHKPFHWFIEFYSIIRNNGFDVIIGNPPYVEYNKIKQDYMVRGYQTESCRNLYAFALERSVKILHTHGRLGLIIPISFASSGAFDPLRKAVWECTRTLWFSHFANRPGQLFSGAQNRLTIALCGSSGTRTSVFSTRYHRWDGKAGERDTLFSVLHFVHLEELAGKFHGLFPKVGVVEAVAVLTKIENQHTLLECLEKPGAHRVYWVRVPGYFCQFFLVSPKARPESGGPERVRGEVNSIIVRDARTQRVLHAILNSSTYYQFFCAYTDGRHINPSDVLDFPLDLKTFNDQLVAYLYNLSVKLEKCMVASTTQWRKSGLLIDSVDSKPSKPIIDEIDRVLAQHYHFTDEELDFVINYDIKYRTGSDAEEEN